MPRRIREQVPVMRACDICVAHRRRCEHKVAVYLPRKGDGLDAKPLPGEPADEAMPDAVSDRGARVNKRKAAQVEDEIPEVVRSVRRRSLRSGGGDFGSEMARQDSDDGGSNASSAEEEELPEAPNGLEQGLEEEIDEDLNSDSGGDSCGESSPSRSVSPPAIEIASPTPSIAPEVETRGPSPLGDDSEDEEEICVRLPPAPSPPPTRSQLASANASPAPESSPSAPSTPSPRRAPIRPHSRWVDPTKPAGRFSGTRRYTPLTLNTPIYGGRIPPPAPTPPPASR
ncbi:hypothetical protein L873DRAFT_812439 [Choiromyces venosus 120613-1]|uniref:Uncharacterized protein n=1 Tax=Choiromyces venosus 120613-1 TaxID=1336337 RepID=A0A3N4JT22_9PEZI|nr:hypothetical protein L873DRAFT_812439 [Choiromyces venosus 120613-1]